MGLHNALCGPGGQRQFTRWQCLGHLQRRTDVYLTRRYHRYTNTFANQIEHLYGVTITYEEDYKSFKQLVQRVENKFKCPEATFIAQQITAKDWSKALKSILSSNANSIQYLVQRMTASEAIDQICAHPTEPGFLFEIREYGCREIIN